ncbi:hypothetical protein BCR32DRAFT_273572 [Anaeromyces robustus]|uniref:Phosphoglycerate mutase-like protein n=1 Tax=Anaeromyces robustus TaxID=1754192 RepID=A0A1Y1VDR4_9FUNG|nr:hypothetical protein BCR32DRAFT_273572 [Anaeromyces robustus]|eukprot:ORX53698.1 hypothetical protein BCR32DRAFT_273572 [Anaeromyces robustus]
MKFLNFITLTISLFSITTIDARRLLVIRHGEKISDDYIDLSDRGNARAQCLYKVFNSNTAFGKPQSIYANKRGSGSHRPYDTVKPLADSYGLRVNEFRKYEPEVNEFVSDVLNKDPSSIILLSSAREWIPVLLKAIGYKIDEDSVDDFDNIWVIENDDKKGHGKLSVKKQKIESCIEYYLEHGHLQPASNASIKKTTIKKTTIKKTSKKTTSKKSTKKTTKRKTKKSSKKSTKKSKSKTVEKEKEKKEKKRKEKELTVSEKLNDNEYITKKIDKYIYK